MTHLLNDLYAVPVPEDARAARMLTYGLEYQIRPGYWEVDFMDDADLYEFLFLSNQATEGDWEEVVEFWTEDAEGQITHWTEWKDYTKKKWYGLLTATESGLSLMASKGCVGNHVILKKEE